MKTKFDIANNEAQKLIKKYDGFNNIIFDNWRGWRFVFDTREVRNCQNDCQNCNLYKFLNRQRSTAIYARLIKADKKDREIFGSENFLNCKSLESYKKCYINFILKRTSTEKEIRDELNLLMNMRIIYSSGKRRLGSENDFKTNVINSVLAKCDDKKRIIINNYLLENKKLTTNYSQL